MQVSNTLIIVAAEVYIALLIGAAIFFFHARKLKKLIRRQQEKLLELLKERKNQQPQPAPALPQAEIYNYKSYLNAELDVTAAQFATVSPEYDIAAEQPIDSPLFQRILALRYAFLRAEELGTTELIGTEEYWNIFQQALTPFLPVKIDADDNLRAELETSKKRIENLEKFKRLFFDMEGQWGEAKANAENYYAQLMAMSEGVADREGFNKVLQSYHNVYDDIHHTVVHNIQNPDSIITAKTINITRQDPRAADEIIKLRNVAADQHRIINTLQRKLEEAVSPEEREAVIEELQQQLQRQIRFVQESETCVQLLEEELQKAHEQLMAAEKSLTEKDSLGEENLRMKSTLHSFTLESKDLVGNLSELEKENDELKQAIKQNESNTSVKTSAAEGDSQVELKQIKNEFMSLKQQYAELEEKYLDLKLSK